MSRLLIGNFDLEWSLAHPQAPLPMRLQRLSSELAFAWLAIAEPNDVILLPAGIDPDHWTSLARELPWPLPRFCTTWEQVPPEATVVPWGWSERLLGELQLAGLPIPAHPPIDIVRRVNSRAFSHQLELDLGCGLAGSRLVHTLEDVRDTLRDYAARTPTGARWIIKADLSNSARERLIGQSPHLSSRDQTWLEARLRAGPLAFEPWIEIIAETGVQWDIPAHGDPQLMGVTPLLTDARGHYRGSLFAAAPPVIVEWNDAVAVTRLAAQRIQQAGYFGPLGIDACRYRTADGVVHLRPLQDINARWTMGRLSLGWRRLLAPRETALWRHGPGDATLRSGSMPSIANPDRIIVTSPGRLAGQPTYLQHRVEVVGVPSHPDGVAVR